MLKQLFKRKADVFGNLTQQDRRDIAALMKGHSGTSTFGVPKLFVRTSLPDFRETQRNQNSNDFAWF